MNVFGALGYGVNDNYHNIKSKDSQNNLYKREVNDTRNNRDGLNYRIGSDFFLHKNHTLGFLVSGRNMNGEEIAFNKGYINKEQLEKLASQYTNQYGDYLRNLL